MAAVKERLDLLGHRIAARWQELSTRERRMLIAAAAALALSIAVLLFVKLRGWYLDIEEQIEAVEMELDKDYRVLRKAAAWERRARRVQRESAGLDRVLLQADSQSLATAELQGLLERLARTSDIKLGRLERKKPEEDEVFTTLRWALRFTTTPAPLRNFLHGIESNRVYLEVEDFQARVKNVKEPKELDVRMTVAALMRTPPGGGESED